METRLSYSRNRLLYAMAAAIMIALGLASRKAPHIVADTFGKYPGDIFWATMVYFLIASLSPKLPAKRVFFTTFIFSTAIEFLKLYRAPWMIAIRHSTAGALVFGHVFTWQNLPAYVFGAAIGLAADLEMQRHLPSALVAVKN